MRFRFALVLLYPVIFLSVSDASAQKRVFATVNPNAEVLNGTADLFDPLTGKMGPVTGRMRVAREQHVAVTLRNGKVLIAGGYNNRYLNSAEIFNPATGSFAAVKDKDGNDLELIIARSGAAGILLPNGRVLVAGGFNGRYLDSAEVYDPSTDRFRMSSSYMSAARLNPAATLTSKGKVLITGGFNGAFVNSADIYDPMTGIFTITSGTMAAAREGHAATLLSDGKILVTGGCNNAESGSIVCDNFLRSAEVYDPETGTFADAGNMIAPRFGHTSSLLPNGKVLIAGGWDGKNLLRSAEIYDPATRRFTETAGMGFPRSGHTASVLSNGRIFLAGGYSGDYLPNAEIFDPSTGAFTMVASTMAAARIKHAASVLRDGTVLLSGGRNSDLLVFDVNERSTADNISPNIVFSADSRVGFVPYTGSGVVVAFSPKTGTVLAKIATGGRPAFITPLMDGRSLGVVSVLDDRIFIVGADTLSLRATYRFAGTFGFGSILTLSPDGNYGYISSTGSGEVIKFDVATGKELGRLKGMQSPAQITVTRDGSTLLIVDASANEVVFADAALMTVKRKFTPTTNYASASFTIFNKAVLNADETVGVIGSQDADFSLSAHTVFVFDPSTGKIVKDGKGNDVVLMVGNQPGYTVLTPSGSDWLVLNQDSLSIIPTGWPQAVDTVTSVRSSPLVSPDGRYAYYTSSIADQVFQLDLRSRAVVGAFPVGDYPNASEDQASSLALTPDLKTMAVLNFVSNELSLLDDIRVLKQTKFVSEGNEFTGLSLVNLSDAPANLTVTAIADGGVPYALTGVQNPVQIQLAPNAQAAFDVSQLLNLDIKWANEGRLEITSDQPAVSAFTMTGSIHSAFLSSYVNSLLGIPVYPDYRDKLHDFIVPEIPQASGTSARLYFVNPNYNASAYNVIHYGTDGTVLKESKDLSIYGSIRESRTVSDLVSSSQVGQILIVGGTDSGSTLYDTRGELFDPASKTFSIAIGPLKTPRTGHSASRLQSNKILIAGGKNASGAILKSSELFDADSGEFTSTAGTMKWARYRHTATVLASGKVLLAGGQNSSSINATAELFDPRSGSYKPTAGTMNSPRDAHTATLLSGGKVLLAGGIDGIAISATAELYDPTTSSFQMAGNLHAARAFHTAVLLPDGKVLIAGGYDGVNYLSSAELYDPATGLFAPIPSMIYERSRHSCTLLSDGTVLIAGGRNSSGILGTAEIYDPVSGLFFLTDGVMAAARAGHTATLRPDDSDHKKDIVLIAGGVGIDVDDGDDDGDKEEEIALKSGEIYDPNSRQFTMTAGVMTSARREHTALVLQQSDQGYLRITSKRGLLFTEIYDNGGASAAINGIDVDKFAGVTRIYSPQFAVMPPVFETLVNIINANQDSEAFITLTLRAPDGRVLASPVARMLPMNGQLKGKLWDLFHNDPGLLNQSGWLEVTSSVDRIVGTVSFAHSENKYLTSFQLSGTPLNHFLFPLVAEDSLYQTGIALLNSGDVPANAWLELWNPAGTLVGAVTMTLAPRTRKAETLSSLFPGMQPHSTANVRIRSDQPLHSFAILYDRGLRFLSSIPAVAFPEK